MDITITGLATPPPPPPPTRLKVELVLTIQEARLLRAALGNQKSGAITEAVKSALQTPPENQKDEAVQLEGLELTRQVAFKLAQAIQNAM